MLSHILLLLVYASLCSYATLSNSFYKVVWTNLYASYFNGPLNVTSLPSSILILYLYNHFYA